MKLDHLQIFGAQSTLNVSGDQQTTRMLIRQPGQISPVTATKEAHRLVWIPTTPSTT